MIVLRAIGAFFAKIWRWIRETAWVQPLLIVGLIFGIMFSIKPIYNAIKDAQAKSSSAETYYRQFQVSLANGEDSQASKLTDQIYQSIEAQENKIDSSYGLGNKFFLMFVAEDCDKCNSAKGGFEYFQENFSSIYSKDNEEPFHLVTIFTDEVMSDGSDSEKTAFISYLEDHVDFFETVGGSIWDSPYHINGGISDSDIEAIQEADPDNFLTPTIMLVDFSASCPDATKGVTDVFVGVEEVGTSGNADANKAEFIYDAWTHQGKFERV
ncbi:MAG: hypothetical protein IJQ92_03225 [Bacilli bacterium]|nr:hypothetical protein [Bacilli bacterium]